MTIPVSNNNWVNDVRARSDHREFVGPSDEYDLNAAMQFNLLTSLGLREFHTLLDIGCGSLRGGRLFIVYLLPEHYYGIEPEEWLIKNAAENEIGKDVFKLKSPSFSHNTDFACSIFSRKFDFFLIQGVFTHAPERQIRKCFSEASSCMKPTSILAATYFSGDSNYDQDEWLYPGTTSYTPLRMTEMASAAGLSAIPIDWFHPRGASWILVCKPENVEYVHSLLDRCSSFSKNWYAKVRSKLQSILRQVLFFK